jgi:glycerol-3-phosphate dehydrogenase
MAEVVTDQIAERLGKRRPCRTRTRALDGAPEAPWPQFLAGMTAQLSSQHRLAPSAARHLVHRYGRRAAEVAGYLARQPDLAKPVVDGEPDLQAELAYQRDCEMAIYPADHLLRRTRLGLFTPNISLTIP